MGLFDWAYDLVYGIWCVISNLDKYGIFIVYSAGNGLIDGLAAIAELAVDLLPAMPDAPDWGESELPGGASWEQALGIANYFVPMDTVLEAITVGGAVFFVLFGVNVVLRLTRVNS